MQQKSYVRLEYDKVKMELMHYVLSYVGRQHVEQLEPSDSLNEVRKSLDDTAEATELLQSGASVPLPSMEGMEHIMSLVGTGYMFVERDFMSINTFLNSCDQLKRYMASRAERFPRFSTHAASMQDTSTLKSEIERCIQRGRVLDSASKELAKARKKMAATKDKIHKRLNQIMSRHRSILQENLVSMRGNRYVLPVIKSHHKQIPGAILDESSSGQTVYVEPHEIGALIVEMNMLAADEAREEAKILSYLTELVDKDESKLRQHVEITGMYDFIIAKAKYAQTMEGQNVELNLAGVILIRQGKHPLLHEKMNPLNIAIGGQYRSLIITGPNTGGKTIALKTVGLLTLMVQSGLLVPVQPGSQFAIFSKVMAVIGDEQSIEQSLSTFSAHMKGIIDILETADSSTLMLVDEMAAGTDPGEGIALSIAIMEQMYNQGAVSFVTTHFNELKTFAARTDGFENARMEFNAETLQPLYQLTIGEAGRSYALIIAQKLGIDDLIVKRAQQLIQAQ
ncbi:DNA mismatch repair protein MutS [Paenibacillus sp. 481]|nr:DNA mismatch repair protein MutS [Paenibacillus sp. 481]